MQSLETTIGGLKGEKTVVEEQKQMAVKRATELEVEIFHVFLSLSLLLCNLSSTHVGYGKYCLLRANLVVNHILLGYHGYAYDCARCARDLRAGLSKNAEFILPTCSIYKEERLSLQQDVHTQLEEGYTVIFEGLFERSMTFQQEVTILSRDTPTKAFISPLLSLNGCATVVEKVFLWDEDKIG